MLSSDSYKYLSVAQLLSGFRFDQCVVGPVACLSDCLHQVLVDARREYRVLCARNNSIVDVLETLGLGFQFRNVCFVACLVLKAQHVNKMLLSLQFIPL